MNPAEAMRQACDLLAVGELASASEILASAFSTPPAQTPRGKWALPRLVKVFVRDGFTDRYSGEPLVFPGALGALSVLAPSAFPYHPNWKQSVTHPAYWTHNPTIDHVVPVARGGPDDESNIVTTSMLRNAAKGNWLPSELGWSAERVAAREDWDGLLPWFCREHERNERLRRERPLQQWYRAATNAA